MKNLASAIICLFLAIPCQARTIIVDANGTGDYPTIQAAIIAASDYDIIEVQSGTYTGPGNRDIDFLGKAITVQSANGPTTCIIDCQASSSDRHRGFNFHSGEGNNSVIKGFTIANGYASSGGGIFCSSSSPTISHCILTGNSANTYNGGAISCENASPIITQCLITGNFSYYAGIKCHNSSARIINCTITDNFGYGILSYNGGNNIVSNCIIWNNQRKEIDRRNATASYSNVKGGCSGTGNINVEPNFVNPGIGDYHLSTYSPCINAGDPNYINILGETDIDGEPRVVNGRIDIGADELNFEGPILEISQTSYFFHALEDGARPKEQSLAIYSRVPNLMVWEIKEDCSWLKVIPDNGEFLNDVNDIILSIDIAGMGSGLYKCNLTITALGALNSPQTVEVLLYVSNNPNELYVPDEYETIQSAIDDSNNGDTVIIAPGIYTGDGNRDIDFLGKSIIVSSADPNDPNMVAKTIIDCSPATTKEPHRGFNFHLDEGPDSVLKGVTIQKGVAPYGAGISCFQSSPTIKNCVLVGNSVPACYGSHCWKWNPKGGGGIYCGAGNPSIISCAIIKNRTSGVNTWGGGIFLENSSPKIINCTITENSASGGNGWGGGVYCRGGEALFSECLIADNYAADRGAGIYSVRSNLKVTNSILENNLVNSPHYGKGGAVYSYLADVEITNCIIIDNSAKYGGGVYYLRDRNTKNKIRNCTVTENLATYGRTLAYEKSGSSHGELYITNSIFWNGGNEIWDQYYFRQNVKIYNSDIQGGWKWSGRDNLNIDPCFVGPGYWDPNGTPDEPSDDFWVDGDYHLLAGSPCIDAGDNTAVPADIHDLDGDGNTTEPVPFDLDGNPRIVDGNDDDNSVVDMGAYEFVPAIEADIDIDPDTLNLKSKGKWITCYIWLGEGYDVADIDPNSVWLEEVIAADWMWLDEEEQVAMAKFRRCDVQDILDIGQVELTISGELTDGTRFEGTDTIKVIDKGNKK